jgi:hypothetical protein
MTEDRTESNNITNPVTCEAVQCSAPAMTTLIIPLGNSGSVLVSLCKECAENKFQSPAETEINK